MKPKHFIIISLLVFIVAVSCTNTKNIVITTPDLSKIADGEYQGNSKVGPVQVTLDVTMQKGAITSIEIIQHRTGKGKKAEAIVPKIIEKQSLEVDVISGATYSSKAILQAAENALKGK